MNASEQAVFDSVGDPWPSRDQLAYIVGWDGYWVQKTSYDGGPEYRMCTDRGKARHFSTKDIAERLKQYCYQPNALVETIRVGP